MSAPEPGWYHADGDPVGTARYWDGELWQGDPVPQPAAGGVGQTAMQPPGTMMPGGRQLPFGSRLGEVGERLIARIIDGLIIVVPLIAILLATVDFDEGTTTIDTGTSVGWAVFMIAVGAAYDIGFTSTLGGTPGKLAMGLRIVEEGTGSMPPSLVAAAKRWSPALLGLLPAIGGFVGLIIGIACGVMINNDSMNRSVYDRVGGTIVVKK